MNFTQNPQAVYYVLGVCVGIAASAFIAALYLTRRSKVEARREVMEALSEIDQVSTEALERIAQLDREIIDSLRSLSPVAQENFSLAKQFVALMERRREKVEALLEKRTLESLFKAHRIVTSPLENAGDHLTSVVFASTVLHLLPGQFSVALDAMLTSVEYELAGSGQAESFRGRDESGHRKRKFTIRGFLQSLKGE